jgi:GNAT superfamily N-acetyltransferase
MTRADVATGLALCRASGWNQTAADWDRLLASGGDGCRVALLDDRVVGTVTTVSYEGRFAWIGMVLVDPAVRGRGIGRALLEAALDGLGIVTARLDATPEGHPLYQRLGFVDERQLRRLTTTSALPPLEAKVAAAGARPMRRDDLAAVLAWDREVFGADRQALLEWALAAAPDLALVVERGAGLEGYCLGRRGHLFTQIGPIVAGSVEAASRLVAACRLQAAGSPLVVDAPTFPSSWIGRLIELGFAEQRPFIRMCRGVNAHSGHPDRQLAIFGPEWG